MHLSTSAHTSRRGSPSRSSHANSHMAETVSSPWRIADATVEISMSPRQYGNGGPPARQAATKIAMKSFLMKYNKGLRGVPMALQGPLRFPDNSIRHIAQSPFSHVTAKVKVLLFAPRPGCVLTGKVVHVGADNIGISVLGEFHAYIDWSKFYEKYVYERRGYVPAWRYTGNRRTSEKRPDVRYGTWVKFSVVQVLPASKTGLFNIAGTVLAENAEELGLGFCDPLPEPHEEDDFPELQDEVMPAPENTIDESMFAADTAEFNDDLAHLIDESDKAPLEIGIMKELENKLLGKKRRNAMSDNRRKERRRLGESPLGDVDLRDEDQAHLRAPTDNSPFGGQNPETSNFTNNITGNKMPAPRRSIGRKVRKNLSQEISAGF